MELICPHCGAAGGSGAFCVACGMALPRPSEGPRVIESGDLAATGAGQTLQAEQLRKQAGKAANALLALAILQILAGIVLWMLSGQDLGAMRIGKAVAVAVAVIGVIFFGLFLWARRSPLPASIVGLVLYVSLMALDVAADPKQIFSGIIIKIIIIAVLIKAIQAGMEHRRLLRQMAP